MHFHNTFPLISPSAYWAARSAGAGVVKTLHNYRLVCVNGLLFRNGAPCEDCLGRTPLPGVVHGCYRGSRAASAATALMLTAHRVAGTWEKAVHRFIALTPFAKDLMVNGGLPTGKVSVKPNFLEFDPGTGDGAGGFALYVGRLSAEKGLPVLLEAWSRMDDPMPLRIVGDGPLRPLVQSAARSNAGSVEWLGQMTLRSVVDIMGQAAFLVVPSECYEGMPRTIIEAFARGTPVVASDRGGMREMVEPDVNGVLFPAGDSAALATTCSALMMKKPAGLLRLRKGARATFVATYSADGNYARMMSIYGEARAESEHGGGGHLRGHGGARGGEA